MYTIPANKEMKDIKGNVGFKYQDKPQLIGQPVVATYPHDTITRIELRTEILAVDHGTIKESGLKKEIEPNTWEVESVKPLKFKLITQAAPAATAPAPVKSRKKE